MLLAARSTPLRAVRQRRLFSGIAGAGGVVVSEGCRRKLAEVGFVSLNDVLDAATVAGLRVRLPLLFKAEFDTGVYPDEMHWREGISREDAPREVMMPRACMNMEFNLAIRSKYNTSSSCL